MTLGLLCLMLPWTLDGILDLKTVADPQISGDGTNVAYVVRSVIPGRNAYQSQIWIVPAVYPGSGRALAAPHASDHHPRWSPDGRLLGFLSKREGVTQVYVADSHGSAIRRVSNSATDISAFRWAPDGREIGYLAPDAPAPEEIARVRAGDDAIVANQNYKYSRLYTVPLSGGKARLIITANRQVTSFDWSPAGGKIVYAGQDTPRNRDSFNVDLYEVDLESGRETPLVSQPGRDADPCYSRDGRRIAFHSQAGSTNYFEARHVGVVASGGGKIRYITERLDADVFRGGNVFWWSESGSQLVFGAGKGTHDQLYSVSPEDGSAKVLVDSLAGPSSFSMSRDGRRIAFIKSSNSAPPDVYLADGQERRLSDVNPQARAYPKLATETVRWKSKDGLEVEGVLRLPVNYRPGMRVPLLVELHGGPTGAALEGYPIPRTYPTQLLAQEGFAVLAPNFRGSSNYGAKFRLANIRSQGFGDLDDIMTGIDTLVERGIADPDRLGVMGWSYGGFLTAWIIGHSHRFRAASIGAPATDWINWYGRSDGPHETMWTYFGGKPWDTLQIYREHSPRYALVNARTPSLLLHGKEDIDDTPELFQALTDLKIPVEYVTYPREGHGISEPMHQRDLMQRNLTWFLSRVPRK